MKAAHPPLGIHELRHLPPKFLAQHIEKILQAGHLPLAGLESCDRSPSTSSLASAAAPYSLAISDVLHHSSLPEANSPRHDYSSAAMPVVLKPCDCDIRPPPERDILLCKPGEAGPDTVAQSLCSAQPLPGLPHVLRLLCGVLLGVGVIGPQPVFLAASASVCVPRPLASLAISPSRPSLSRQIADNFTFYTLSATSATGNAAVPRSSLAIVSKMPSSMFNAHNFLAPLLFVLISTENYTICGKSEKQKSRKTILACLALE